MDKTILPGGGRSRGDASATDRCLEGVMGAVAALGRGVETIAYTFEPQTKADTYKALQRIVSGAAEMHEILNPGSKTAGYLLVADMGPRLERALTAQYQNGTPCGKGAPRLAVARLVPALAGVAAASHEFFTQMHLEISESALSGGLSAERGKRLAAAGFASERVAEGLLLFSSSLGIVDDERAAEQGMMLSENHRGLKEIYEGLIRNARNSGHEKEGQ